jgi:hypothetical protein
MASGLATYLFSSMKQNNWLRLDVDIEGLGIELV